MKLTLEQQKIVEDNHSLIYGFANKHGLDLEKYYGVLAIALCKAVSIYDDTKGKLSTLVYKTMRNEVSQEIRKERCLKRNPPEVLKEYSDDLFQSPEMLCTDLTLETKKLLIELDEIEQSIIQAKIDGMTIKEICEEFGVSRSVVNKTLAKLKGILKGT